jgi:putative FmdB family regulatory protein
MPTYLYHCLKCKHRFDEFQSITEPPLEECPKCGGPVERLITGGAGFLLKGSGFYGTDYRSDAYNKSKAADTGGGSPPPPSKVTDVKSKTAPAKTSAKQHRSQGR